MIKWGIIGLGNMGQKFGTAIKETSNSKITSVASLDKNKIKNLYFTDFLQILIKNKIKLKAVYIKRGWLEFDQPNDLNMKL